MRKVILTILLLSIALVSARAQTSGDTVMILPFENDSRKAEFNWVGESFADALSDLLTGKFQQPIVNGKPNNRDNLFGFNVVSNDERKLKQQEQKIPLTSIPSLATSLRFANKTGVSKLIIGSFNIVNTVVEDKEIPTIIVKTRIIDVRDGSFDFEKNDKGEPLLNNDNKKIFKEIVVSRSLTDLQSAQGEIAYQILLRQKVLTTTLSKMINVSNKVPAKAFEAYIKGLLTSETDLQTRENYFRNALRIYANDELTKGETYSDVALELGHLFRNQNKYNEAIDYFSRVPAESPQYAEAAFYTGLIQWQQKNYEQALAVLRPLAGDLKLTSVYSTMGAIAVQASVAEKKNKGNADKLLQEGSEYLKKAAESAPDDMKTRFNYAFTLFLNGGYKESADYLRPILAANPRDGEAYFLLAKALEKTGDATAAADLDNQARRFLTANNRYAKLESDWKNSRVDEISLRVEQPLRKDFVSVVLIKKQAATTTAPVNETETLLVQARAFYAGSSDDEAMAVLRKILASEPMSAEAYLLLGNIHLRRGDLEQAVSSLKTALFWDNRLINAYVGLGKIYLQRGDCLQAKNYAMSALAVDAENQDALGLQRLVERCSK